jgi:hypothetical protein
MMCHWNSWKIITQHTLLYCFSFVIGIKHCVLGRGVLEMSVFSSSTSCDSWIYNCFWLSIFKNFLLWNHLAKWTEAWYEASICPLNK